MFSDNCNELFNDLSTRDVNIPYGRFHYPCRFKHNPEGEYLSVQLHGRAPRGEGATLPVFARWNWGKILGAHVLSICDPTIYLDDSLLIGWYLGCKEESAIQGVMAIAERFAASIGIAKERVIYSGGSGGGFAALQAAALHGGKAIAINAQTDLLQYAPQHVADYVSKASGCSSVPEAQSVFGDRWNAIHRLQKAHAKGESPKIVVVQNRNEGHFQSHFTPLAAAFGLSLTEDQSINGNFMSMLYDGPPEHGPEPSEVVKRINRDGIEFLLGKKIDAVTPEFSTHIALISGKIEAAVLAGDGSYQYACYLYKDGSAVQKRFYSSSNLFSFDTCGPGKYHCLGFVREEKGSTFSEQSTIIQIGEQP